jgi:hypothetical protein
MSEHLTDTTALDLMAARLSGVEWDADDIEYIASLLRLTGREIKEPDHE